MKNASLLIIALAFLTGSAVAQEDYQKFRLGFELDPNISWFKAKSNDLTSTGAVARIGGGVNIDIFFQKNYALGTGFFIRTRGGKLEYFTEYTSQEEEDFIAKVERTYNTKFIEVPLTFKLKTDEIGRMRYYGQFGLGLGFAIGARGDETYAFQNKLNKDTGVWERDTTTPGFIDEDLDIGDQSASLRTSMIIAAGVELAMSGTTAIKIGLTFNNGFSNAIATKVKGIQTSRPQGDILFEGQPDGTTVPKTFDLKAASNSLALNVGILF